MKILLLPCHEVLERDELEILLSLGHHVFSAGSFVCPENRGDQLLRPGIDGFRNDPEEEAAYHALGKDGRDNKELLTRDFVDRFDAVIVHHIPAWIERNWEVMKHKRVIWRTIGQSVQHQEQQLAPYRAQGMQVVRYSPAEARIPSYLGHDAIIRFAKDPEQWKGWTGEVRAVLSVGQDVIKRRKECNWEYLDYVTTPFARKLLGNGSEAVSWGAGRVAYDDMKQALRSYRCFFYTGTQPASYTLGLIEAMMTGIPVVSIGPIHAKDEKAWPGHDLFEVPEILRGCGVATDDPFVARDVIATWLRDHRVAGMMGEQGRKRAVELFGVEGRREEWRKFLG